MAALRAFEHGLKSDTDALVLDGNGAYLAALALDGDGVLAQRAFRRCRIEPHDLMDTQSGEAAKIQRAGNVVAALGDRLTDHAVELRRAPRPIDAAEATALQLQTKHVIVGQMVLGVLHLVVEEADRREIGLDGTRRLAAVLQVFDVGDKVFATDV